MIKLVREGVGIENGGQSSRPMPRGGKQWYTRLCYVVIRGGTTRHDIQLVGNTE